MTKQTKKKTAAPNLNMRQCNHCAAYFNERSLKGAVHLASCRVYNGHPNYETWLVSLWIDNEETSHLYWRETAEEVLRDVRESGVPERLKTISTVE